MQIEELVNFSELFDIYGKLLSNKQYELLSEFLNYNLGESEIAEGVGASRQAVHDAITKAKKQLLDFEKKCGVLKNKRLTKSKLENLKEILSGNDEATNLIDNLIDNL